jgi:hypothetical protein
VVEKGIRSIDPVIEKLGLVGKAYEAAYKLKWKHPDVKFTSGRRNRQEQAHAMARNIVGDGTNAHRKMPA